MGYRRRTGFMAGLTVAQISEFSIVFVAMGITLGHVGVQALSLTTLVGLVTITASTYMILYAQPLYERLAPWLRIFERRHPQREAGGEPAGTDGGWRTSCRKKACACWVWTSIPRSRRCLHLAASKCDSAMPRTPSSSRHCPWPAHRGS
jgi:hypothetical protein